jgi:peptidoglycan hydrolase-like amidase
MIRSRLMLALLLHVQILGLLHPHRARVWPGPVQVQAGQRYGGNGFEVEVPGLPRRAYRGTLLVEDGGSELRLVNEVELEDYVASVVGSELDAAPRAAQAALAIAARTFALYLHERGEPLCDTTHCQFYKGRAAEIRTGTEGEVLESGKALAFVQYSAEGGKGRFSQSGAAALASRGATAHQIVAHYFPELHLGRR